MPPPLLEVPPKKMRSAPSDFAVCSWVLKSRVVPGRLALPTTVPPSVVKSVLKMFARPWP